MHTIINDWISVEERLPQNPGFYTVMVRDLSSTFELTEEVQELRTFRKKDGSIGKAWSCEIGFRKVEKWKEN